MSYGSWAIVPRSEDRTATQILELQHRLLAIEGVTQGRDVLLFVGTLEEFASRWGGEFTVVPFGAFIRL